MEISWKLQKIFLGLPFLYVCNGFPINLEDSVEDEHTQLLTGLVAVLLTVCSIVVFVGCLCCQRRNGFKEFHDSPVIASTASNLDHGHINPVANGEFTIFTPLSSLHYNNNVFLSNERIISRTSEDYVYKDFDVRPWLDQSETDFPRVNLKYIKELGRGWFGKVVQGAAKSLDQNEQSWSQVVVRILDAAASRKERVMFLYDAEIYRHGTHPNILALIGRCLDTVPLLLLQEFCSQGDLKDFLRSKKDNMDELLNSDYPLLWCCQLTSALKHIHNNKITHPDLATRNCQLTSDLTLKLGDYGLTVIKYPKDYYEGSPRVPVRWCSPESLTCTLTTIQPKKITFEGNIWSLGVAMWEIYECGEQPYPNLSDDEVISQVLGSPNERLTRPSHPILYTDYIYRLMQLCWSHAESRPTVGQIDLMITDLLQVYKNTKNNTFSLDDFDKRWASLKPNALVKYDNAFEREESKMNITKPFSPSLNNLHGSLDNLLSDSGPTHIGSWLENISETKDSSYTDRNVTSYLDDSLGLEVSSSDSGDQASPKQKNLKFNKSKINFDGTSTNNKYNFSNSKLFSQRSSSESETEDENWRNKVERGAYTEKVRLKSRSVADLMILTHVDCSESESETPLPSLDCRMIYKNVRYAPKNNLENLSLTYGSEGNLLSLHDTFQEELKKLKEERRDSLLFVPDANSQNSFNKLDNNIDNLTNEDLALSESKVTNIHIDDSTSKRLMHELNNTVEIKPVNQVFNVFSVTIDKFKPIHVNSCKLNDIINFREDVNCCYISKNEPMEYEAYKRSQEITEDSVAELIFNKTFKKQNLHNRFDLSDTNIKDISLNIQTCPAVNDVTKDEICPSADFNCLPDIDDVPNCQKHFPEPDLMDDRHISADLMEIVEDYNVTNTLQNLIESVVVDERDIKNPQCLIPDYKLQVSKLSDIIQNKFHSYDNFKSQEYIKIALTGENDKQIKNTTQYESHNTDCKIHLNPPKAKIIQGEEKTSIENEIDMTFDKKELHSHNVSLKLGTDSNQEKVILNTLKHISVFTSTPSKKKQEIPLQDQHSHSCVNLYGDLPETATVIDNTELIENLNYSLETWDNFLGKTLDNQNEVQNDNLFDSFSSEPHSLLFSENGDDLACKKELVANNLVLSNQITVLNKGNVKHNIVDKIDDIIPFEDKRDKTFVIDINTVAYNDSATFILDKSNASENYDETDSHLENGGGWFLHPQTVNKELSGVIEATSTDSYVGFGIDDEIMTAIRNELLTKLPHAQGIASQRVEEAETEEWDLSEKNEVFLKYNVYNPPLSPILEESYIEEISETITPKQESENDSSDWSEQVPEVLPLDLESQSVHTYGSPYKGPHHRHTPSQDSCCSNDTLFNLEELTNVVDNDKENYKEEIYLLKNVENQLNCEEVITKGIVTPEVIITPDIILLEDIVYSTVNIDETNNNEDNKNLNTTSIELENSIAINKDTSYGHKTAELAFANVSKRANIEHPEYIKEFLLHEREHASNDNFKVDQYQKTNSQSEDKLTEFVKTQCAPLPSPEDNPWKQLPASMLNYNKLIFQNNNGGFMPSTESKYMVPEITDLSIDNDIVHESQCVNIDNSEDRHIVILDSNKSNSVNIKDISTTSQNMCNTSDIYESECIVNYENTKNNMKSIILEEEKDLNSVGNINQRNEEIKHTTDNDENDIFGVLTDIRFHGPIDNQLMSTSFSESNDINDEQDWDSGSDSRSSSSGEFIWKEGEHEESLKALRAAPQDMMNNIKPMEGILEESSDSSDISSSISDEEGEIPEFIPSAWDKFATPTKSALRSPEKTLHKTERKKAKGVWFKKQKYHCIYEYPREPESPVLQSNDLWKPQIDYNSFTDWEFDADTYLPLPVDDNEILPSTYTYQPKKKISSKNLYQLTSISDFVSSNAGLADEFFVSSSARPFDMVSSLSSQFFPGSSNWTVENATPDSGMEDMTPGSLAEELADVKVSSVNVVQTLRILASEAVDRNKRISIRNKHVLGGLRHTRNKLKLNLPPSPSAFTSTKTFTVEPSLEAVVREKPTFTTFGKSRFMVQHVDTPPDECKNKNVSFEVLPHKPLKQNVVKFDFEKEPYQNNHESNEILPDKKHIAKDNDHYKRKVELVRGEASLLDSADEDSGIESSTLERKLMNNSILTQ